MSRERKVNHRQLNNVVKQPFDENGSIGFDWRWFKGKDGNEVGQYLNEWEHDEILYILKDLIPHILEQNITILQRNVLTIYNQKRDYSHFTSSGVGFPKASKFTEFSDEEYKDFFGMEWKDCIVWARFRLSNKPRLVGVISKKVHKFYPIFLDKNHEFYPTYPD